ncbi:MAG TPA: dihydrofolate reductase [Thermoanaerobaculia bacterium]|nr:dihydrofolate reductase [Thermoanaerobaculia bacterium]
MTGADGAGGGRRISLIAAMAENRVIGRGGALPWRLPADLRRFKRLTLGHTLVMGRKTFEAIGRPLPGRATVVVTRREGYAPEGVAVAHSIGEALAQAAKAVGEEIFVAGGAEIYRQTLPLAARIFLTVIAAEIPGDAFFPAFEEADWRRVEEERHEPPFPPGDEAPFAYRFLTYERR